MTDHEKIARLESENALLKARLRAAGLEPPAVPMPDDEQTKDLLDIVLRAYPGLAPPAGHEDEYIKQFRLSLLPLAFMGRLEKPNRDYYPNVWRDKAQRWLRRFNYPTSDLSLFSFIAACVASDIVTAPIVNREQYVELGLHDGGGDPVVAWPDVLQRRRVRTPRELPSSRLKPLQSPIRPTITRSG